MANLHIALKSRVNRKKRKMEMVFNNRLIWFNSILNLSMYIQQWVSSGEAHNCSRVNEEKTNN